MELKKRTLNKELPKNLEKIMDQIFAFEGSSIINLTKEFCDISIPLLKQNKMISHFLSCKSQLIFRPENQENSTREIYFKRDAKTGLFSDIIGGLSIEENNLDSFFIKRIIGGRFEIDKSYNEGFLPTSLGYEDLWDYLDAKIRKYPILYQKYIYHPEKERNFACSRLLTKGSKLYKKEFFEPTNL